MDIILLRKYFEFGIYKHHKCSIFSAFFICTILLFIASFLPDTNIGNQYQFVKNELGSVFYCIPFIFIFIVLSFIKYNKHGRYVFIRSSAR